MNNDKVIQELINRKLFNNKEEVISAALNILISEQLVPQDPTLEDVFQEPRFLTLHQMEKKVIEEAINKFNGNLNETCKYLEITKAVLTRKIKEFNIKTSEPVKA